MIITVSNQKGGVGKTTTSAAICAGLADRGAKVLGVDLDPQGNLGFCMGLESGNGPTIADALNGSVRLKHVIRRLSKYDILPSDISLSAAGLEKLEPGSREYALRDMLRPVQEYYDYIIIDTPPALNLLTVNAYAVSDYLIIPMATDILSLVGLSQLRETIESVRQGLNPELRVLGILLNRYDRRTTLSRDVLDMAEQLAGQIGTRVFRTKIRSNVSIAEAPAHGEDIFTYNIRSAGVQDYLALIEELSGDLHLEEVCGHGKENT